MLKHLNSSIASRKLIAVLVVTMLMVAMACNGEEDPTATSPATEAMMEPTATEAMMPDPTATEAMMPDPTATEAMMPKPTEAMMMLTDPLVIGHLNAFTGSLSYFGETHLNAVNLAAKHINDAGGIHGAQIEVIEKDTGVNPVQGVDAARALVSIDGVVAIVGSLASGVTLAVAESVTIPQGVLQVTGASTSPAITVLEDNDFLFRTAVSDAAQGVVLARVAQEQGYSTVGIMYINNAYGDGLTAQFEETFNSLGGTVTAKVAHEETQPTFTSELEKATEGDPDVLIAISYPGQAEIYLRESLEGGYADNFLFVDATKSPEMMEVVGWAALDGTLGTAQGAPDSPALQAFQSAYDATYGEEVQHPFTSETYDATVLIALAAAKAGTTTDSTAIRDALRSVANPPGEVVGPGIAGIIKALELIAAGEDINYEGAAGTVDFDENGDVVGYIEVWQVKDGEIISTGRFELP
jgi:ABC-type branched-subunit amino acid transport system substrate-binding protein